MVITLINLDKAERRSLDKVTSDVSSIRRDWIILVSCS